MHTRYIALAAGALMVSSGVASAATVSTALNLRAGPGTNYSVIDTMPQGTQVQTGRCAGSWCRVNFRGESGWASANYLDQSGGNYRPVYRTYRTTPGYGAFAAAPDYYGDYYDRGPGFGIGFGRGGFAFGFGPDYGTGWYGRRY